MADIKLKYPDVYKHRSYRNKYRQGYGAEGVAAGKTDIGEMRKGMADCAGDMKLSPKDKTYKKADAVNAAQMKISHKTKPSPF